jgi:methylated-DNA-[protein]-cysteine S-methyltransferase
MKKFQWQMDSRIGPLFLVVSEKGLQGLYWKEQPVPRVKKLKGTAITIQILSRAVQEIQEYLNGERKKFELPLDIDGTPFQKKVWNELVKIPYGETCSYKGLALKIEHAAAVRAVGTANGRNPLSIVIPCHRVIASDGSLGGYAGGLEIKSRLLDLESK